jgi:metal-sulfur cluster biosynthetic enzyme
LEKGGKMVNKAGVMKQLSKVMDPELDIDIVSLGLIYEVIIEKGKVKVEMTLTTPGCPLAPVIDRMVKETVAELPGIEEVDVTTELIWDPPWTKEMMTEAAKLQLGMI